MRTVHVSCKCSTYMCRARVQHVHFCALHVPNTCPACALLYTVIMILLNGMVLLSVTIAMLPFLREKRPLLPFSMGICLSNLDPKDPHHFCGGCSWVAITCYVIRFDLIVGRSEKKCDYSDNSSRSLNTS